MKLIIDCRERDLKTSCETLKGSCEIFKDITIETENLELGDIIIRDNEGKNLVIYERKTISDLIASIKDGRYTEQSFRMNGLELHNHNIVYLIEGNVTKTSKEKQTIFSAMFSVLFYKGFSVMRSTSLDESAYILLNAFYKIQKEKGKSAYYTNKIQGAICEGEEEKSYSSVIKTKKNANITPDNFGEIVLCQIPSVNSVSAVAIMKKFGTLNNLISSIKENDNCLDGISYETDKKQTRKISKTVIKNIIDFLREN